MKNTLGNRMSDEICMCHVRKNNHPREEERSSNAPNKNKPRKEE